MRSLPSLIMLVLTLAGALLRAQNPDPIIATATIPDKSIVSTVGSPAINLQSFFAIPSITDQVVQFTTTGKGVFNVEMKNASAPNTVANFLAYVNANRFANSLVHRTDTSPHIIQGGGYIPDTSNSLFTSYFTVLQNAAIPLETGDALPNSRGTIAMARKSGDPNSATSEWFINTQDNSSGLPTANAGGYAVFGRVTGTGMTVVDSIAALPVLTGIVTVTSSSTANKVVTVDSATLPANFGAGWSLLGSTVQFVSGNFVTLTQNANQAVGSPTPFTSSKFGSPFNQLPVLANLPLDNSVAVSNLVTESSIRTVPIFPATPGGPSVVTFSAASSNPGLVTATVSGSNLFVAAAKNLTGSAIITVTATDTNGNATQSQFNVTVTRKVADFNNDGIGDLIFQNNVGQIGVWYSGSYLTSAFIYGGGLGDWRIVAIADVNGDGVSDILFQNTPGQVAVWYSGLYTNAAYIYDGGLGDWRVVGVADINSDGVPDLIFQNNIGQVAVWYSGSYTNAAYIYGGGLGDWHVVGIADMNSDGIPDLVFQNNVGQIAAWYSFSYTNAAYIYGDGLGDWKVVSIADVNGDGIPDLLFQNTPGQVAVWYNALYTNAAYIYAGGLGDWHLQ